MVIDMTSSALVTLAQVRSFLAGTPDLTLTCAAEDAARYQFIAAVAQRFGYTHLPRSDKGVVRQYLIRMTGYSRQQLTRLLTRWRETGRLEQRVVAPTAGFRRRYTAQDVQLLAEMDALHGTLSGPATCVLLRRAFTLYGDARYVRLAQLSVAHLYNLRKRAAYQSQRRHWTRTRPTVIKIGVRKPPRPEGRPGFIRIDSVHQGDQDGVKGLYHINAVDCVTQWELVATCERISEAFLLPVLQVLLEGFPFVLRGFHADNGGEYINRAVAKMLAKLNIELTRSRPRHSNDNALAETKNGAVVRKHLGYTPIPQRFATGVNIFCASALNPYLNFHRPCFFAVDALDTRTGKLRKRYPQDKIMTPFDKLKSLP